jgi:hypothetical protein
MANSNGKITAPVSMSDISQVIGTTQDLTRSPNINRWAKFKPVRATFNLGARPSDWWKSDDGWCGLSVVNAKISSTTNVSNIASKYSSANDNGWEYLPPRKGIDASRVLDFEGYNHYVLPFITGYTMPAVWAKDAGNFQVSFMHTITDEPNADFLSYKDLPFENYYLGLALIGDSNGKVYRCTNPTTIEGRDETQGSSMNMTFPVANVDAGKYMAYPFMSDKLMNILDGGFVAANVYTLPSCGGFAIEIKNKSVTLQIQGIFSEKDANGFYSMTYTIRITNDSQATQVFSNNYIQLRYSNKKFTDTLLSDEKQMELNLGRDITVNAGQSNTIYGVIANISESLFNDPIIWVSLDSSVVLQSAVPQQNIKPNA